MFTVHSIQDVSDKRLINFLKKGLSQVNDDRLIQNYHPDYAHDTGNLFHILKEGRYHLGSYYIIESNGEYVGSAGWNPYTEDIALALTRAYIVDKFRTKYLMASLIMPRIIDESKNYSKLWITCNEYNKTIYEAFVKMSDSKPAGLFNPWPSVYKQFVPIGKRTVNYTEQYVAEMRRD